MNKNTYNKMTDGQLIQLCKKNNPNATEALFTRYEKLVHKQWHWLSKQMNGSSAVMEAKDDFYSEAFIACAKAIKGVKISAIKDDNWKFLGYYGFHLSNLRNTTAQRIVRKYNKETSMFRDSTDGDGAQIVLTDYTVDGVQEDIQDEFVVQDENRRKYAALNYCRNNVWDEVQNRIWDMKAQAETDRAVKATLGLSAWALNKNMETITSSLQKQLEVTR